MNVAVDVVVDPMQKLALEILNKILLSAEHYRETGGIINKFHRNDGICYNIESMAAHHTHQLLNVKDNLIRQTPSYSGNYHYPVANPDGGCAERCWNDNNCKWDGAYGALRIQQLKELIHLVETQWEPGLIEPRSPARRIGLKVGDTVLRHTDGQILRFVRDDDSSNPAFAFLGKGDHDSFWEHVNNVRKIVLSEEDRAKSVSQYVDEADTHLAKQKEIREAIAALEKALQDVNASLHLVDYKLAEVHRVRRLGA